MITNTTLKAQAVKVAKIPTFTWFTKTAQIPLLGTYLADAAAQQASTGKKYLVGIVLYNLPDRQLSFYFLLFPEAYLCTGIVLPLTRGASTPSAMAAKRFTNSSSIRLSCKSNVRCQQLKVIRHSYQPLLRVPFCSGRCHRRTLCISKPRHKPQCSKMRQCVSGI